MRTHRVKRGDSLRAIASRYGLTVDDLAVANDLNPEKTLDVGVTLTIPRPGNQHYHVVRTGETASQIARDAGCTITDLRAYNKLRRSARLRAGQVLKLPPEDPGPRPSRRGAAPRKTHVVAQGESLNSIAHRYGVGTKILMRANGIRNPRSLRPGRRLVIPEPRPDRGSASPGTVRPLQRSRRISGVRQGPAVIHWAMDGQTWRSIARAYKKSIPTLRKANPRLGKRIRAGDPVRIPGASAPVAVKVANCGYPAIRFVRAEKSQAIRLFDCKGRVSAKGRRQVSAIAAPRGKATRLLHPELLKRLQRVADEFPGRPFRVVSGYRPAASGEQGSSRHNYGRAFDFSIEGIPNRRLFQFCRQLPSTGCGLYPNSTFVHMDFRDQSAHWIDNAGPGEAPEYVRPDP